MKLLLFSDLHCDASAAKSIEDRASKVDVLVGAGDFANARRGIEVCIDILGRVQKPAVLRCDASLACPDKNLLQHFAARRRQWILPFSVVWHRYSAGFQSRGDLLLSMSNRRNCRRLVLNASFIVLPSVNGIAIRTADVAVHKKDREAFLHLSKLVCCRAARPPFPFVVAVRWRTGSGPFLILNGAWILEDPHSAGHGQLTPLINSQEYGTEFVPRN